MDHFGRLLLCASIPIWEFVHAQVTLKCCMNLVIMKKNNLFAHLYIFLMYLCLKLVVNDRHEIVLACMTCVSDQMQDWMC